MSLCLVLSTALLVEARGEKPATATSPDAQPPASTRYVGTLLPMHKELNLLSKHRVIARFDGIKTSPFAPRGFRATYADFIITEYLHYRKPGEYGDDKQKSYRWVMNYPRKQVGDATIRALIGGLKPGDQILIEWKHLYGQISRGKYAPVRPLMLMQKVNPSDIAELKRLNPPVWVHKLIDRFEAGIERAQSIVRYTYRGKPVFYVLDEGQPSKLFDAAGKLLATGDAAAKGGGLADFLKAATDRELIWERPTAQEAPGKAQGKNQARNHPVNVRWSGPFSSNPKRESLVISDQEAWRTAWKDKIHPITWRRGKRVPPPPAPAVDFTKTRLACAFYGFAGAGDDIEVTGITETEKEVVVRIRRYNRIPASAPRVAIGIKHGPYCVIDVPAGKKPVRFETDENNWGSIASETRALLVLVETRPTPVRSIKVRIETKQQWVFVDEVMVNPIAN